MSSPDLNNYLIDHSDFDWNRLLAGWAWLLPPTFTVWPMNRFGDLFVVTPDGTVNMLDIGAGVLVKLANSQDELSEKIDEQDNANNWLMIPLVDAAHAAGMTLARGECYSFKLPPVLGGQYALENVLVLELSQHFGAFASIHNQLRDLPDGTQIKVRPAAN
jgi:hypothetical protein